MRVSAARAVLGLVVPLLVLTVWGAETALPSSVVAASAVLQQELMDPALRSGAFAGGVALDGDTALVAAYDATIGGRAFAGAVDVFVRSGGTWTLQTTLTAPATPTGDVEQFGTSLALDGDTAVIGATGTRSGTDNHVGTAYVFTRSGTTWSLQQELVNPRPSHMDQYGIQVALSGDTVLVGAVNAGNVGAPGEVWAFARTGSVWVPQGELMPPAGMTVMGYGTALALEGDTALVGAYDCLPLGGRVFVFTRNGSAWTRRAAIVPADSAPWDAFGRAVAISGGTALIGGGSGGWPGPGPRAYAFTGAGATWKQQDVLVPAGGTPGRSDAIALQGDTALVASGIRSGAAWPGEVHVFRRVDARWRELTTLSAPSTSVYDDLGACLALDGSTALAGNPGRVQGEEVVGACDVFLLPAGAPPAYPVTTAFMTPGLNRAGWSRRPVSVALQAADPVASVTGTFIHGPSDLYWTPYTGPITVTAEGVTTYAVFSTDAAGNTETLSGFTVRIDTVAPKVSTAQGFGCKRGAKIVFRVALVDASAPLCSLYVRVDKKSSGKTVKTASLGKWPPGKSKVPWRVSVAPGSYVFHILATDLAGNRQKSMSSGSLVVR